jgi:asparagine synthetase B (glutamine-hydrolysing)
LSNRSPAPNSLATSESARFANADWIVEVMPRRGAGPSVRPVAEPIPEVARQGDCDAVVAGFLLSREGVALDGRELSDAELIAVAYSRDGPAVLPRLRGSFALVLTDRLRREVLCLRDPLGTNPLFYAKVGSKILLSPSLERLRAHEDVPSDLNAAALVDHLCHRWPDPGETLFASIRRVPVAHLLRIGADGFDIEQYWQLPTPEDWIDDDELDSFEVLFEQAVARPATLGRTGVFLSGGFDSVSVAAIANDLATQRGGPLPLALSLGFPHPDCDEQDVQRWVASTLQLQQILMPFDDAVAPRGLVATGIELSARLPLPLLNPWRPAYVSLARAGRANGCDLILTGAGGDEWLTVNPMYMADLLRSGNVIGAASFARTLLRSYRRSRPEMIRFLAWHAGLRPLILLAGRNVVRRLGRDAIPRKRRRDLRNLAPPWVAPSGTLARHVAERIEQCVEQRMREPEPKGGYGFYFRGMDSPVLHPERSREQEEEFAIGRDLGLSIQHPYWDPDLVSFLCRVPPRLLLANGREKGLVREATNRRFPGAGFERQRKVSAVTFFRERLEAEALPHWREMGGATALASLGIVDPEVVESAATAPSPAGRLRRLNELWELMALEAWARRRL